MLDSDVVVFLFPLDSQIITVVKISFFFSLARIEFTIRRIFSILYRSSDFSY